MGATSTASPLFQLRLRADDHRSWVLDLAGELDVLTAPAFVGAANAVPATSAVELEMADLTFCDSVGMRAIVAFAESRSIRPVTLRNPCLPLIRLLEFVDTSGILRMTSGEGRGDEGVAPAMHGAVGRERSTRLRGDSSGPRAGSSALRRAG